MAYSLTVRDTIDSLRDWSGGNAGANSEANIRKAIRLAVLQLTESRLWSQYTKLHRIFLQAPYSAGTLEYDHAGGSSERLVTIDGGTLPTDMIANATGWDLVVGSVVCRVAKYLGSTTLQLDEVLNFGADVASGSSYELFKSRYLLPADFRCLDEGMAENLWCASYVQPRDWLFNQRASQATGQPVRWTVTGDSLNRYRQMFLCEPAPSEAETLDMWYQRKPRDLAYSGYNARESAGTVTSSGTTVTGTNTTFDAGMVGALIRFGSNASQIPDGLLGQNPYSSERIVTGYASATSITIDSALTQASSVKYVVSDPIDIDPAMEAAFTRACEYQLAVLKKASEAEVRKAYAAWQGDLMQAQASDRKVYVTRYAGDGAYRNRSLGNMPYNSTVEE